ncbi:MAG: 3-hydroxybutyryl-CoA dehydrogenase [Cryomorphaceae bacterium BACL18 MAG-120507-bin74]|nr:MAG: 3-hydroxybutyryl-CoA dehydrogenase [Cryomorphaceae bacterium BACL18 MAG-120507-bin74]
MVVGAGAMGGGIAQVLVESGWEVLLYDTQDASLENGIARVRGVWDKLVEKGKISDAQRSAFNKQLSAAYVLREATDVSLVIEAIYENLDAKRSVFTTLDDVVREDCILATNTSSLSVSSIAAGVKRAERVVGLHFFNPAPLMPLVEIIPGIATAPEVVEACVAAVAAWGKVGVVAKDTPGFLVNRIARPFYGEALHLFEEQMADMATIDWALTELGGFRMGPFALMDLIGHDVNYVVTETVWKQFYYDPRFRPSLSQKRLLDAGWLGRKSGRGFYDYRNGATLPEPTRDEALGRAIVDRVVAMLINEAADAVYRGIGSESDVETAMLKGVNYPKGLIAWGREWGWTTVRDQIEALHRRTCDARYRVCPWIHDQISAQ